MRKNNGRRKPLVSLSLYAGSALFYVLGMILPVAKISEFTVSLTTYDSTDLTVFGRLSSVGTGILLIPLGFAVYGIYASYTAKTGILAGWYQLYLVYY